MIKAVIFDCWGTLFYDDTGNAQPFVELSHRLGKNLGTDYEYLKMFEHVFMLKKCDRVDVQMHELIDKMGITISDGDFDCLVKILKRTNGPKKAYPEVMTKLANLRQSYKTALISNCFSIGMDKLEKDFSLNLYFDSIIKSCDVGMLKPDPKMFQLTLDRLGVRKDEVLMVGNSVNDDILAAQAFGIRAVLIDRKNMSPNYTGPKIFSLNELDSFLV